MATCYELSDFERGVIIGCYRSGKSIYVISVELEHPKSTVPDVISKWRHSGITSARKHHGRKLKLTEIGECYNTSPDRAVEPLLKTSGTNSRAVPGHLSASIRSEKNLDIKSQWRLISR